MRPRLVAELLRSLGIRLFHAFAAASPMPAPPTNPDVPLQIRISITNPNLPPLIQSGVVSRCVTCHWSKWQPEDRDQTLLLTLIQFWVLFMLIVQ